jgi:hypothetical protein
MEMDMGESSGGWVVGIWGRNAETQTGVKVRLKGGIRKESSNHAKRNYAGLRPLTFFSGVQAGHSRVPASHHFTAQRANPE